MKILPVPVGPDMRQGIPVFGFFWVFNSHGDSVFQVRKEIQVVLIGNQIGAVLFRMVPLGSYKTRVIKVERASRYYVAL